MPSILSSPVSAHHAAAADAFAAKGYALVADFVSPEIAALAYRYGRMLVRAGGTNKETRSGSIAPGSQSCYADPLTEALLEASQPLVETIVRRPLWPTYSFCRLYHEGNGLTRHLDRPSCEYSVSICLGRDFSNLAEREPDYVWPLFANGEAVGGAVGSAVVYRGFDVEHWREPLRGREQFQTFLHYVDREGDWADCRYDFRPWIGAARQLRSEAQERAVTQRWRSRLPGSPEPA
ncbi:MAG TPA: hypothetical protein VHE13_00960 [Opitutus sp.]|nr:hypothetical protein [Opitutus sp.]